LKRTSFTAPLWPGNLFRSFPVRASHIDTLVSPLPAAILSPFASQLAFRRLRSCPVGAPSYVLIRRSFGAKGRTSHVRTVESWALDSNWVLSGDSCNEVTVSVCPSSEYVTAFFLRSQTLISLSMPPVNSSLPASDRAMAVIGNSVAMKLMASLVRVSQSYHPLTLHLFQSMPTYPDVSIVGAADKHLLSALADVHAIDHLLVTWVPPYPLARLHVPACQVRVCGGREQHFRVSRPMQIQYCLLVAGQDSIVVAGSAAAPEYCASLERRNAFACRTTNILSGP
jgi:hypothetical protein